MKYLFELTKHRPAYWGPPESAKHMSKEREYLHAYTCKNTFDFPQHSYYCKLRRTVTKAVKGLNWLIGRVQSLKPRPLILQLRPQDDC